MLLDAAVVNAAFAEPNCGVAEDDIGQPHLVTPHLNPLPLTGVADQIRRNAEFLTNTYGSDESPFFRPPHGVHNPDIDQVAADAGYTTLTRWSADIGNSRPPCPQSPAATPSKADLRSSSSDTAAKRSAFRVVVACCADIGDVP